VGGGGRWGGGLLKRDPGNAGVSRVFGVNPNMGTGSGSPEALQKLSRSLFLYIMDINDNPNMGTGSGSSEARQRLSRSRFLV
jgi:hypothetical protein